MDNNDFLTDWGLTLMVFLPLAGALLMMLIPKGEEQLLKVVALGREPGVGGVRRRRDGRLRLRRRRHAPVRGGQGVDRGHQGQLLRRHRRAVAAAHRAHAAGHAAVHRLQLEPLPRAAQPEGVPHPHPRAAHGHARHLRGPGPDPLLRLLRDRAPADVLHDRRVGRRAAPVRLDQVLPLHAVRLGAHDRELPRAVLRHRRRDVLDDRHRRAHREPRCSSASSRWSCPPRC